jgi:hypothetical protein
MELTKSIVRQWKADSEWSIRDGSVISDWHEGRISICDFLLSGFDLPEGN